jgi:hypothetical protein
MLASCQRDAVAETLVVSIQIPKVDASFLIHLLVPNPTAPRCPWRQELRRPRGSDTACSSDGAQFEEISSRLLMAMLIPSPLTSCLVSALYEVQGTSLPRRLTCVVASLASVPALCLDLAFLCGVWYVCDMRCHGGGKIVYQ